MRIDQIRIYFEVLEQGVDLKEYLANLVDTNVIPIKLIQVKGNRIYSYIDDSVVSRIRKLKNFDVLVSFVSGQEEYPISIIEYSTAVPTDDHIMQRYDANFWACFYLTCIIKISPTELHNTDFGGGTRLRPVDDKVILFSNGGISYHINWDLIQGTDYVLAKNDRPSCPLYSDELEDIFANFINIFHNTYSFNEFYETLLSNRAQEINEIMRSYRVPYFQNSSRILHLANGYIEVKINRFGHAMDPDKGMLVFFSMSNNGNVIAKFDLERATLLGGRGSYSSLFDGVAKYNELLQMIEYLTRTSGSFDLRFALKIFMLATSTESLFTNCVIDQRSVVINDHDLIRYLQKSSSQIFVLLKFTKSIRLYNSRGIVAEITWNINIIENYLARISEIHPYALPIRAFSFEDANEDIITYVSKKLFISLNFTIVSASYPSAQGDRAIINGMGRSNTRDYIDLILSARADKDYGIVLQENKTYLSDTTCDANKLIQIRDSIDKIEELEEMTRVVSGDRFRIARIFLGVGGKRTHQVPSGVDYVLAIDYIRDLEFRCSLYFSTQESMEFFVNVSKVARFDDIRILIESEIKLIA